MINKLVQLLIAVFIIALIAFGLDWVMTAFGVVQPFRSIVWCIFGLIVLVGVIGLLGYGPFAGTWKNGMP